MKKTKYFVAVLALMMVFTFIPSMAFADDDLDYSFTWLTNEQGEITGAQFVKDDVKHEAELTAIEHEATCTEDAYAVYTAKYGKYASGEQRVDFEGTALGHDWVLVETTLIKNRGLTGYWECQREGCDADHHDRTTTLLDSGSTEATCFEAGTITKEGNVYDPTDKLVRIEGTRADVDSHFDAGLVIYVAAVEPTCTEAGNVEYWYCTEDEKYFIENEAGEKVEVTEADVVVEAIGHDYDAQYNWAKDGSQVKGSAVCKNCGDTISETVETTSEVKTKATCSAKGVTTYTATFENEVFTTQTKDIEDIAVDPDNHDWKVDYVDGVDDTGIFKIGYAECKDCSKKAEPEKVHAEAETVKGVTTLTFKFSTPFETQTDTMENHNQIAVKAKTVTAKAKKATKISAKKAFVVTNATGKVTYKKMSGNKKITVKSNGKIVVKKGLKSGKTYTIKVKVSAAGNDDVMAGSKTVKVKIKVK